MKSIKNIFKLSLMAAYAFSIASCGQHAHGDAEEHKAEGESHSDEIIFTASQAKEVGLKTEVVEPREFANVIKAGGQILSSAGDEHTVVATADGVVALADFALVEGSAVSAGHVMARISSDKLQEGDAVRKAKAEYVAAESDYRRAQTLAEGQIVSQKQLEQARLRYETARAAYAGLSSNISNSGISVPFGMSGYIKSMMVKSGDYVTVGTPLCVVAQSKRLRLRVDVPEQYVRQAKSVISANFTTSCADSLYSMSQLNGRVLSYGKSLYDNAAYLPVTFEFDNRGSFVAGSYADVWLIGQKRNNVISLPVCALTESLGLYYVYLKVKGEDDAYTKREVILGDSDGKRVEVVKGLRRGDVVVTEGAHQVRLAAMSGTIPEGHSHSH